MARPKKTDLAVTNPTTEPSDMRLALRHLRARAQHNRTENADTIAELEAWRREIDATIAFLKARS